LLAQKNRCEPLFLLWHRADVYANVSSFFRELQRLKKVSAILKKGDQPE